MTLDLQARYTVRGWRGIAFRIAGFPKVWEPWMSVCVDDETGETIEEDTGDGEWVEQDESCGRVIVVMVGDDKRHEVDTDTLTPLGEGDYCDCCGSIGCNWGSRGE